MRTISNLIGSTLCLAVLCGNIQAQTLSPEGEGRRAWLKYNCYGCHGMRAEGGMAPNVQGDDAGITLEGSSKGMPSYRAIVTEQEVKNLGRYLKSIGTPNEPTFTNWWFPIPPK
jgi:cytochrome c551